MAQHQIEPRILNCFWVSLKLKNARTLLNLSVALSVGGWQDLDFKPRYWSGVAVPHDVCCSRKTYKTTWRRKRFEPASVGEMTKPTT